MGMACTRSLKEQVEPYVWKYAEGFHIRDVLYFGQNSNYTVDSIGHICNKGNIVGNIFSVNGNTLVVIEVVYSFAKKKAVAVNWR